MRNAILLNDTVVESHLGCYLTTRNLKKLIEAKYNYLGSVPVGRLDSFHRHRSFDADTLALLEQADVVFINGEGSIHSDNMRTSGILAAASYIRTNLKIHVALVNHSALSLFWLSQGLRSLDYIAVRETTSLFPYLKIGLPAALSFDCSILEDFSSIQKTQYSGKIAVVHGQTSIDYREIERKWGVKIDLVDCCFDQYGNLSGMEMEEAFGRLSDCDAVISSSFHGCIFSYLVERPLLHVPARNCKNSAVYRDVNFKYELSPSDFFESLEQNGMSRYNEHIGFVKKSLIERAKLNVPPPSFFDECPSSNYQNSKSIYYQGYGPLSFVKNGFQQCFNWRA